MKVKTLDPDMNVTTLAATVGRHVFDTDDVPTVEEKNFYLSNLGASSLPAHVLDNNQQTTGYLTFGNTRVYVVIMPSSARAGKLPPQCREHVARLVDAANVFFKPFFRRKHTKFAFSRERAEADLKRYPKLVELFTAMQARLQLLGVLGDTPPPPMERKRTRAQELIQQFQENYTGIAYQLSKMNKRLEAIEAALAKNQNCAEQNAPSVV